MGREPQLRYIATITRQPCKQDNFAVKHCIVNNYNVKLNFDIYENWTIKIQRTNITENASLFKIYFVTTIIFCILHNKSPFPKSFSNQTMNFKGSFCWCCCSRFLCRWTPPSEFQVVGHHRRSHRPLLLHSRHSWLSPAWRCTRRTLSGVGGRQLCSLIVDQPEKRI